jgi:hypothetical protein
MVLRGVIYGTVLAGSMALAAETWPPSAHAQAREDVNATRCIALV